jgi:hypothetical protein
VFTVNIDDDEFKVEFRYLKYEFLEKIKIATVCDIREVGYYNGRSIALAAGIAVCSPQDQFNKNTGRKLALSRALSDMFSREERQLFWDAYFQARNGRYD